MTNLYYIFYSEKADNEERLDGFIFKSGGIAEKYTPTYTYAMVEGRGEMLYTFMSKKEYEPFMKDFPDRVLLGRGKFSRETKEKLMPDELKRC